jgi:hypothetical protein
VWCQCRWKEEKSDEGAKKKQKIVGAEKSALILIASIGVSKMNRGSTSFSASNPYVFLPT